jgi:hypothetical protein
VWAGAVFVGALGAALIPLARSHQCFTTWIALASRLSGGSIAMKTEFRHVLRPGGELRFYEHVRARRAGFARRQRRVDAVWSRLVGGCHRPGGAGGDQRGRFRLERCRGFGFPPEARAHPVVPRVIGLARAD